MSDRIVRDARKMVSVVDDLLIWMLESRPDLEGDPVVAHVRKYNERLRESAEAQFDMDRALEEAATRGRSGSSGNATDVAKLRAGTGKQRLAEVYFQYPEGLTADEAAQLAGLTLNNTTRAHVFDLKGLGSLRPTGRERGGLEVLTMTLAAQAAWRARYGDPIPVEVLSMFGDDVEVVL
jgi:hypothetical protein